jgi:RNA polymerase sigma factor (sigma-70 family)
MRRAGRPSGREYAVPDNDELAALVDRVARLQDRDAFIILFDHYAPRINGYLQRLGTPAGVAEELAQDVMVTLWRKAALFDSGKSSVGTWLFRIARNRRIDMLRRDRMADVDENDPALQPSAPDEVGEVLDAQRREERVRVALKHLPAEQLALVELAFFKNLTHSQIADETGLPLGTVKSRIRLAFTRLRKILEDDDQVDTD